MIAVSENLLREYLKYKKTDNKYDKNLMQKFFKYYQPFVVSVNQLINIGIDKKTVFNLLKHKRVFDNLSSKILAVTNEEDLIKHSKLKLMIRDDDKKFQNCTTININENRIKPRYSATYKENENRKEAKKHIKSLLHSSYVNKIEIYDKYIFAKNNQSTNLKLLKYLFPENKQIQIYTGTYGSANSINKLRNYNSNFIINNFIKIDKNMHDRYIVINDNLEIILSSGFYYLENNTKDLTYIVRIRDENNAI